jgi:hypothetical protein
MSAPAVIERWHRLVKSRDPRELDAMLAGGVVFESPVVHTPQVGRAVTRAYLAAALSVLNNESFRYLGEWFAADSAVLEFETVIDGIRVNGVDMIRWNAEGRIVHFKVMLRPLKAIQLVHQLMAQQLAGMQQQ